MAELIEMEKVAGRYEPAHDLMQDIPQSKKESVDVKDHIADAKPSGNDSPEKVKQTLNNFSRTENIYQAEQTEETKIQTAALSTQTKAISQQTEILQKQGEQLEELNMTMSKLYDVLYKQATKLTPTIQETGGKEKDVANGRPDQGKKVDFGSLLGDAAGLWDMFGGKDKNGNRRRRTPGGRRAGFGNALRSGWNSAKGFVSGLGNSGTFRNVRNAMASGGGGWRGKLLKGAAAAGAGIVGYKGLESLGGLGSVSAHFESGGKGVDTISTGRGDHGGVSYGKHQLSSKAGTMAKFLRSEQGQKYAGQFAGLQPGTASFNEAYKQVVAQDREGFSQAQESFMKATHYDPLANKISRDTGLDVSGKSRALQELVYSTATQYGGNTSVVSRALEGADHSNMSDDQIISRIQDYKRDSVGTHFRSSSADVQASVANRAEREKAMLLKVLEDERKNEQQIAKDEKREPVSGVEASQIATGQKPLPQPLDSQASHDKKMLDEANERSEAYSEVAVKNGGTYETKPGENEKILAEYQERKASENGETEPVVDSMSASVQPLPTKEELSGLEQAGIVAVGAGTVKAGVETVKGANAASDLLKGAGNVTAKGATRGALRSVPLVGNVVVGGMEAADIITNDEMSREEKERGLVGVGGGMAGATAGATAGAAMGSVVPVVGTAIGGIVGGGIGYYLGQKGAEATMDVAMGTPEERIAANQAEARANLKPISLIQGEKGGVPTTPGVTLPSVKELMTVKSQKAPTDIATVPLEVVQEKAPIASAPKASAPITATKVAQAEPEVPVQSHKPAVVDAKPKANSITSTVSPESPASNSFYKTEPVISQKPQMASASLASSAPQAVTQTVAPEPAQRQQYDTVQNVRMAVDQPRAAAPAPAPSVGKAGGNSGQAGSDKPTLDEIPALVSDFGLLFVNSGFI